MKSKLLPCALLLATSFAWAAPATTGIDQYELKVLSPTSPTSSPAIPFRRCTAPMSIILNSGNYVICPRQMPELTGPIWAVRMY